MVDVDLKIVFKDEPTFLTDIIKVEEVEHNHDYNTITEISNAIIKNEDNISEDKEEKVEISYDEETGYFEDISAKNWEKIIKNDLVDKADEILFVRPSLFTLNSQLDQNLKVRKIVQNKNITNKPYWSQKKVAREKRSKIKDKKCYPCDVCHKKIRTKTNFNAHKRRCEVLEPYLCLLCGKQYANKADTSRHIKVVHEKIINKEPYKCEMCNMFFKTNADFTKHNEGHRAKSFECGVCHKQFHRKWNATAHMSKHFC